MKETDAQKQLRWERANKKVASVDALTLHLASGPSTTTIGITSKPTFAPERDKAAAPFVSLTRPACFTKKENHRKESGVELQELLLVE